MAPHELNELKDIIEMVNLPLSQSIGHVLTSQDELRKLIVQITSDHAKLEERVVTAEKDVGELVKKMDELQQTILGNQQKNFKQTIAVQGAILLLILGAFISYIVPVVIQSFHH